MITLLERDLHHVDHFVATEGRSILTSEHLLGHELSLVNLWDLSQWNDDSWLLWEAAESQIVFVHEEAEFVEDEVSFDQIVMFIDEFTYRAIQDDTIVAFLVGRGF